MEVILDENLTNRTLRYAGFWIRVGAYIIDGLIVGAFNGIVTFGLVRSNPQDPNIGALFFVSIAGLIYFALMESSSKQATLGKLAVGIKVGNEDGSRITFANALGRTLGKILSAIILYIGFMMVGWDKRKQGLHDKLAGTIVYYA
jgi:uncharacterized RDD family membrane protein YckC